MHAMAVLALAALPGAQEDVRVYVPPPEPGYIYTVIQAPRSAGGAPVALLVHWGEWRQTGRFGVEPGAAVREGVVLRLRHAKWDGFPLTVRTSGRIVHGPLQGSPPPQWDQPGFQRVIW